jgi:hypothetical protein
MGGVSISENINFNRGTGAVTNDSGFIEITFPEDMDPTGPGPSATFFYGPFGGTNPPLPIISIPEGIDQSRWIGARRYRIYISVPAFDYTFGATDQGAFYNVSVAGCRDASGNKIQTYGTNGTLASSSITAVTRNSKTNAASNQKPGSSSVIAGFRLCD